MTSHQSREEALRDLVELRCPVPEALKRLSAFGWASDTELMKIVLEDITRALKRFEAKSLAAQDLEAWAEALQGREDLLLDPTTRDFLADALFELSTPELFGPMADIVSDLRTRIVNRA
ncbi:hypothetical protein [Arthrobacter sp. R-11]|uniref:hypothetical protein n=1 Tax=Arthrobacter sp. R-11 TaxID=3404053 RepID=UPI003CEF6B09